MSADVLASVQTADVCARFAMSEEGQKLLRPTHTPRQFVGILIEQQRFLDAVRFLAQALPKREAVWWACLCARLASVGEPPAAISAALSIAEKWAADPSEENRRASFAAAQEAELKTPAGCAAMAAFWSGGSLAPPHAPVVPPAENLTGHGVAGAVLMAAILKEPEKAPEKYQKFLAAGLDVSRGVNRWK